MKTMTLRNENNEYRRLTAKGNDVFVEGKEYKDVDYLGEHLFDEFLFKNGFTEENVSEDAVEHFYSNVFHTVFKPSINGYCFI